MFTHMVSLFAQATFGLLFVTVGIAAFCWGFVVLADLFGIRI